MVRELPWKQDRRGRSTPRSSSRGLASTLWPCGDAGTSNGGRSAFVSVAIRVKPSFTDEPIAIWAKPASPEEPQRRVCCHRGYLLEEYEFSRVFGPEDDNEQLFHDLHGPALTTSVFSGVNETLFAYGQTGSGKTHTIFGTPEEPGLLQLFVSSMFHQAEASPGSTVHACCYEVLGDSLTDLIDAKAFIEHGILQEDDIVHDELFIKTQRCRYQIVRVSTLETCLSLLQDARLNRTSGISSYNADSSRSHAVVHLFVQNPSAPGVHGGEGSTSIGALTLVDLAGTEKEHENPSEHGRKSARLLNTSLSSLNRLLRKLQTGALDESERRQSVLNKCLWEYLRPGCGIALIFCASPLLQHRTTTLSTLAMATDSKLINSQRKSQFIQLPSSRPDQALFTPASSPCRSAGTPGAWSAQTPPRLPSRGERTPRQQSVGRTPTRCAARHGDDCTPRHASPCQVQKGSKEAWQEAKETGFELKSLADVEQLCGYEGTSPSHQELAEQNAKLRSKLRKARARSQEMACRAEYEREQLASDNAALQRECESLRSLFIRQQQQQIAFWTGPFMEMVNSRDGLCGSATAAAAAKAAAATAAQALEVVGGNRKGVRASCHGEGEQCADVDESQETLPPPLDGEFIRLSNEGMPNLGGLESGATSRSLSVGKRFVAVSTATSSGSLSKSSRRDATSSGSLGKRTSQVELQAESELSTSQSQRASGSEWSDSSSENGRRSLAGS
mmetsp:Transcript_87144/g.154264  ORF Transcript_87144/g.154264 Transcript_87144/m.154264 type:complete len:731 (-) Transcript_87144:93-2285(-)